ncbi:DNA-binding transcriptional regulator, LysR family [Amycolatopsis xylanica]|uniref:DNA-binding transcriptional regulator, LysR family n=1 Tax=Amycolatopsis xylanica TaxID=589385 RepID=A0A1H3RIA7_9PSEU|nr:LysR family transcriptional regulator [Amycolatopsis xylanica]SDZ25386.1 DNA-binding transcriptional regulator, LysR family [Amycolatopsis xylanica]
MELELRHLRIVCAIAELGSITKAANTLGMAQPALTAQLKRIERTLGGAVFLRDHAGTRPTALGKLVLDRARMLLPAVSALHDEAARLAQHIHSGEPLTLRLGSTSGPMLGGLVQRLGTLHPETHVAPHASWSANELASLLSDGSLDFAFIGVCGDAPPPPEPGVRWQTLATDPVFVLLSTRHPHAKDDAVELAALADERWCATPGDGCFADCFVSACAKAGFTPRNLYETDVLACVDMVESGHAVVLCQPTFREFPGVVAVPIAGNPLSWRHLIGWSHRGEMGLFAAEMIALSRAVYRELSEHRPSYARFLEANPEWGVSYADSAI